MLIKKGFLRFGMLTAKLLKWVFTISYNSVHIAWNTHAETPLWWITPLKASPEPDFVNKLRPKPGPMQPIPLTGRQEDLRIIIYRVCVEFCVSGFAAQVTSGVIGSGAHQNKY
jgi:hypothetical protein